MTNRPGVFAGGDAVTGPNTVIDAIATGKKAAMTISRWLEGLALDQPSIASLPSTYIEPIPLSEDEQVTADRPELPVIPAASRFKDFSEVELTLSSEEATKEACRCLRCDLEFTLPEAEALSPAVVGESK